VANGETCDEASDCTSGNCNNDICCDLGMDCCLITADCPAPGELPSCDTASTCQGTAPEASCDASFNCATVQVDDDSGCDGSVVALTCDPYADVVCDGTADQTPPAGCPTDCTLEGDCAANNTCAGGTCQPVLCTITGTQGQTVECPLNLVREQQGYDAAVQFQLSLLYTEAELTVASIETCGLLEAPFNLPCTLLGGECDLFGDPTIYCDPTALTCAQCTDWAVDDPDAELISGHAIVTCAQPPSTCAQTPDEYPLLFWGTESQPITTAYLNAGNVTGVSNFATVKFTLDTDLPGGSIVSVGPDDFVASDDQAQGLAVTVEHSSSPNPDHYVLTGLPQ